MRRINRHRNPVLNTNVFSNFQREGKSLLGIFSRGWFIEGLFYITFVALIWSNEEPSKLNTLLAAWSAYAIVTVALFQAKKSGTIINPAKWIRIYFLQSLLLLLVCDFVWLQGSVARTPSDYYDPIRFDWYAVILADSGMARDAVTFQNYTGTIWYAGFIYWVFGVSKFYVALFNGALSFVTWVLFASMMKHIEGNPKRWQWVRFGILLPDFIISFANVSKEPLSAFVVVLGAWVVARGMGEERILSKSILPLIPVLILGLVIRAPTAVLITTVACIWLWKYAGKRGKIAIIALLCCIIIGGQFVTDHTMKATGGMRLNWSNSIALLFDPTLRMREYLDYSTSSGSWNVITESLPPYLMPIIVPVKGFFMMIAPMPLWEIPIMDILDGMGTEATNKWLIYEKVFRQGTAWLFVLSLPWLLAGFFDLYPRNRRLWVMTSLTFFVIVSLMGFATYGMIETRYRPMILPFWLSVCAVGHYFGRPKRYIIPCICIVLIGFIVYLIPKPL
jgi:hypothetical protein